MSRLDRKSQPVSCNLRAWGSWISINPAICLIHEMGHAFHQGTEPDRYLKDGKPYDPPGIWKSPEEKRNIQEIENVVSLGNASDLIRLPVAECGRGLQRLCERICAKEYA